MDRGRLRHAPGPSALAALELTQTETWRIARLRGNSELFVDLAREAGLDTGPAIGRGVVPILFRDSHATLAASQYLAGHGFYVPPIIQVGVPRDQPRLRFFMSATHTEADIRAAIDCLAAFQALDRARLDAEVATIPPSILQDAMLQDARVQEARVQEARLHEVMSTAS